MNAARKAWVVAASIGAVEALKDQVGMCRWNYTLRLVQQYAKNNLRSVSSQAKVQSSSSSYSAKKVSGEMGMGFNAKKPRNPEESVKKVMDLSCWGPSTVRF